MSGALPAALAAAWAATAALASVPAPGPAAPGSPAVRVLLPRGGQRGAEVDVTFHGERLADAASVLFHEPGIELLSIEAPSEREAKARLRIAADCGLGEHPLRLVTRTGLSELLTFWVGPFPCVDEVEPNGDFAAPQPIGRNVTVHGTAANEDVDHFVLEMKAGERLSVEVEGLRLGDTLFDPFVAILDERRFELASCDDSSLFMQDPVASCVIPADGRYVVLVRESSYAGNDRCRYRLHVGTFPRPLVAFPGGGAPGRDLELELRGDPKGDVKRIVPIPAGAPGEYVLFPEEDGVPAPSGVPLRLFGGEGGDAAVLEIEPNDSFETATPAGRGAPTVFDGVIGKPGDVDVLRVALKKDETVHLLVHGRSLRSPLDSVLSVHDANGRQLEASDDTLGLDSYVRFGPPADGEYLLRLSDHLGAGDPTFVWRIVVTPVVPRLQLDLPRFGRDSQARQTIPIPRGNRFATVVHANRVNFGGDVTIGSEGLPPGVTLTAVPMARNTDTTLLLFEAAADAPLGATLADLTGTCAEPAVKGGLRQRFDLVTGPPNDTRMYDVSVNRLAVAVTEEAPFTIDLEPPKAPMVQNGAMQLRVRATRREGFDAPITVRMLRLPPGVGSQPTITIGQGESEALYLVNASNDTAPGTCEIAVLGEAESGRGVVLAASALTPITIQPPFLSMRLELAAVEQGKPVQVIGTIEPATPFEGVATVALRGLPAKCEAAERPITASDTQVVFEVTTAPDTPAGKHTSLFCQVQVPVGGESVLHNTGGGGVLRVDPPPPPPPSTTEAPPQPAPEPAKPAEPEKKPEKPLSRLEQLRLEAQQRAQAEAAKEGGGQRR